MTILLYLMVIVFGFTAFSTLPLALMPSMEVPAAIVYATYPGAGPEDIEQQVAKPLESAVAGLSGLDTLQSTSSENMAMLIVQFTDSTDLDDAMTDLRDKVSQVKSQLPDDASDPTVMSIDIDSMPVVQVALRGSDLAALQSIAEDEISPALERLDGVASVDVSGGYEDEVAVKTNAARLKGYNLTITSVAQQLGADNMAIPGGDLDNGSQTLAVRTDGEYSSLNDVKNALISLPAGGTVRLSQIADVSMQPKDRSTIAKVDGEECIMLSVNKQSGSNTVKVAQSAVDRLNEVIAENDALQADVVMDQSDYINMTVDNAVQNIWMGVLFAAVVLLVFLRDLGATLSLTIAMPCCILFTFLIMNVCGITLNMMSLGGITLGVGMIVDNSIVVLENIFSYRADGYSRWDACTKGTGEVMTSVTASTLTTIAVFLPIALSGGMTGMMFREFCITIVALLLSSLIIALTLVPLLCYMLLGASKVSKAASAGSDELKATTIVEKPLMRRYRSSLKFLITHRWAGIAITLAICVVSVISIAMAGMELIPEMDQGQVSVSVSMPNGSTMEDTAAIQDRIAGIIMDKVPETEQIYYSTGDSTSIMSSASGASVTVSLVDLDKRDRSAQEITKQLRRDLADIAGCEITVSASESMSMSTDSDISVELTGDDYDQLAATADDLVEKLSAIPDAINVESSAGEQTPRVAVKVRRENASRFGLTPGRHRRSGARRADRLDGDHAAHERRGIRCYGLGRRGRRDQSGRAALDAAADRNGRQCAAELGRRRLYRAEPAVHRPKEPEGDRHHHRRKRVRRRERHHRKGKRGARLLRDAGRRGDRRRRHHGFPDGRDHRHAHARPRGRDRPRLLHPRDPVQLVRAADRDHADPADRPARLDDAARAQRKPRFHGRAARRYHSGRYGRQFVHRPDRLYPSAPGARRGQEHRHPQRLPAPRPSGPDDRDDHYPRPRADGILERRGLGDDEADGRRHDDRHGHLDRRDAVHHAGLLLADRQHRRAPEKARSPAAPQGRQGQKGRRQRREHGGKPGFCRINPPDYRCKNQ